MPSGRLSRGRRFRDIAIILIAGLLIAGVSLAWNRGWPPFGPYPNPVVNAASSSIVAAGDEFTILVECTVENTGASGTVGVAATVEYDGSTTTRAEDVFFNENDQKTVQIELVPASGMSPSEGEYKYDCLAARRRS